MLAVQPNYFLLGALIVAIVVILTVIANTATFGRKSPRHTLTDDEIAFAFSGDELIDASASALDLAPNAQTFEDVRKLFLTRFPELSAASSAQETRDYSSRFLGDGAILSLTHRGNSRTLVLNDPEKDAVGRQKALNTRAEEQLTHAITRQAPLAIWATSQTGEIVYRNEVYSHLERRGITAEMLQAPEHDTQLPPKRMNATGTSEERPSWFDVSNMPGPDLTRIHYALDSNAIVHAEAAQRNFVQTLTKTFAQLSIGLAIFDRSRQLALFNPSLIDLTTLSAEFLSARPSLSSFFDQLRDRQIMPEPRNYKTWRNQLSDMLAKAQDGIYCETWTLPSGLTYRISGKPHPDGAVAFLFEDISAEISLSRRFRAELEMSQSILDTMDDSLAVFSRSGSLTFSNKPFQDLWKCNPDESFIEMSINDMIQTWQTDCLPTSIWDELREFVATNEMRRELSSDIEHKTQGAFSLQAIPLVGAATLVRFQSLEQTPAPKVSI